MILEFILSPIFALLNFIVNSLPLLSLPISLLDGLTSLLENWNNLNAFVPVNYIMLLVFSYWVLVNGKLFIAIISWIYEKIPFI